MKSVPDSYVSLLTPLLTKKLPSELRMIIARKFSIKIRNLEELMNYFKQKLHAREHYSSITLKTAEKQILDESTEAAVQRCS